MKKAIFRKTLAGLLGASLMLSGAPAAVFAEETSAASDTETIYQTALMDSLNQGNYDGFMTIEEVKNYGDTGIGTFDGLDGVLIMLDGVVYRASAEGRVVFVPNEETIPFADFTFFEEDGTAVLSDVNDLAGLEEQLNAITEENGKNLFYMIKASGTFSHIKVRTQPMQEKPYGSLDDALASSAIEMDYNDISGTIIGIYTPDYMSSIAGEGWHLHFISDDKTRGGHVLDAAAASLDVSYDSTVGFKLYLPEEGTFQNLELATVPGGSTGTDANAQSSQQEGAEGVITSAPDTESTEPRDPDDHPEPAPDKEEEAAAALPAEPAAGETTYIVQEGDMLYSIASQFGVTPEEIAERNKDLIIQTAIENGYYIDADYDYNYAEYIFPGEELIIPKVGGAEAESEDAEAKAKDVEAEEAEEKAKDAEAEDAEKKDAEAEDAEAKDAEAEDAEAKDAEAEDAEAKDAEAEDAEAKDAEAEDAEAKDAEAEDAEKAEAEGITPEIIKERGVLRVGTTGDYMPMTYLDEESGDYTGFDIEFVKDLADALEVDLEFVPTTWPTLLDDTKAGEFDLAVGGITITEERETEALMSDGYLPNGKTVLCRAEDADKYISLEAINQPEVIVMENPGGLNEQFAVENLPDAQLIIHETNEEIPGLIAEGEADVMITEIMEAGYYASEDDRLAAPLLEAPFTHGFLGFLFPEGSEALVDYVNDFIQQESLSGRISELSQEYIYKYTDSGSEEGSSADTAEEAEEETETSATADQAEETTEKTTETEETTEKTSGNSVEMEAAA